MPIVEEADAVVDEDAVMIHLRHAVSTGGAVVRAWRLSGLALAAATPTTPLLPSSTLDVELSHEDIQIVDDCRRPTWRRAHRVPVVEKDVEQYVEAEADDSARNESAVFWLQVERHEREEIHVRDKAEHAVDYQHQNWATEA